MLQLTNSRRGTEHEARLLDRARGSDSHERLSSPTRKYYNSGARSSRLCHAGALVTKKKSDNTAPISKHFTQARLLIWADDRGRLEIYVKIGIHGIVTKIIFFQHGILELVATLLHVLGPKEVLRSAYTTRERTHVNLGIVDLKGVDIVIVLINLVWQLIRKQCPSDLNYRKTYHSPHRQQM